MIVALTVVAVVVSGITIFLLRQHAQINASLIVIDDLEELSNPDHARRTKPTEEKENGQKLSRKERNLLSGVFLVLIVSSYLATKEFPIAVFLSVGASAFLLLVLRSRSRRQAEEKKKEMEFYLPAVMERVVMAAQAGLDVIPALETVCDLGKEEAHHENRPVDPVTLLLDSVVRRHLSGMPLEQALKEAASTTDSTAVRHVFIHLGLTHKEGGELVSPLRELSDATQVYYQQSIEEEIAKLPVKATAPLLLIFAGLIISFITIPIIQILTLASSTMR